MGRLTHLGPPGWEETYGLVAGIGGCGPLGEGWDLLGARPEASPPHLHAVAPDLDIVYAIRCRRAERLMATHANVPPGDVYTKTLSPPKPFMEVGAIKTEAVPVLAAAPMEASPEALLRARSWSGSGSFSLETAVAHASALSVSSIDMELNLEELTHSVTSDASSDDEEDRPKKKIKSSALAGYYW